MKFLVHLHMYYHNQIDYFVKKLSNICDCDWDLYVTYVEENQNTFDKLKALKPDANFIKVENLGYDVWPFIQVIRKVNLDDYDYVLKLHTKNYAKEKIVLNGCKMKFKGFLWRDELVNVLIGSQKRFKSNLELLNTKKNIGMIASKLFCLPIGSNYPEDTCDLYYLKKHLNLKNSHWNFIAGTMFIIKSDTLKILEHSDINYKNFSVNSKTGCYGTYAHVLERIFTAIVKELGYKIYLVKSLRYRVAKVNYIINKNILRNIFELGNSFGGQYKHIKVLGIDFYKKKKNNFPREAVEVTNEFKNIESVDFITKRAAVFATYLSDGKIQDNEVEYLKEIKKYTDYIVVVADSPILAEEVDKLKNLANTVIFKRHGEYDFGSYKLGYLKIKELGIFEKVNKLLLFNNSVVYTGKSLEDLFQQSDNYDYYGVLQSEQGVYINDKYIQNLHLQSWFLVISDKIFNTNWFDLFIKNIRTYKSKWEIIVNYELGLSKLITEHGFEINSYYPKLEILPVNPDSIYANPDNKIDSILFIKKRFLK